MSKKLISTIAIMLAFTCIKLNAQNTFPASGSTGIGTSAPNASSILEVKSTTKGMLTPRMTKAQRDLIASPATGLLIFQTNSTPGFYFFDGSVWKAVSSTAFPNKTLSNLTGPTKINTELLPDTNGTIDLGSNFKTWKDLYLSGAIMLSGSPVVSFPTGNCTVVGFNAANTGMTGNSNSFFGNGCGQGTSTGSANSFYGRDAGAGNSTGTNNTFMGAFAGSLNGSGASNAFFGSNAGNDNSGSGNSFFGAFAGDKNTTGTRNAFFGNDAGGANTTASDNSFFGNDAGLANTTGSQNSFFGANAGDANLIGNQNAFFGANSGGANITGNNNSFLGFNTGLVNTSGARNVFVGSNAGASNTNASDNSFFGNSAGFSNTTGISNSFFGAGAGAANTQASNNSFFGFQAGDNNTTGAFNAFFGAASGKFNVTGSNNAFYGTGAGLANTASDNSFFGTSAGQNTTTGAENSFFGKEAGLLNVNGTGTVAYGFQANKFRSNSFCIYVGYQSDNATSTNFSNSNVFGHLSRSTGFNEVRLGNTSVGSIGGFANFTNLSDGRYKKNVKQNVPGLEFINKLNPVTYTMDVKGLQNFLHENDNLSETVKAINLKAAEDKEKIVYTGFIAQEVEAAAKELNYDFSGVDKPQTDEALYGLRYSEFTVPLVKAVQELSKENKELKMLNAELEKRISAIESKSSTSNGIVRVESSFIGSVEGVMLGQNLPNPFDNSTIIPFRIPKECHSAAIIISESTGKIVRAIPVSCKETQLSLKAGTLAHGVYSYSLVVDGKAVETRQMILTK